MNLKQETNSPLCSRAAFVIIARQKLYTPRTNSTSRLFNTSTFLLDFVPTTRYNSNPSELNTTT